MGHKEGFFFFVGSITLVCGQLAPPPPGGGERLVRSLRLPRSIRLPAPTSPPAELVDRTSGNIDSASV